MSLLLKFVHTAVLLFYLYPVSLGQESLKIPKDLPEEFPEINVEVSEDPSQGYFFIAPHKTNNHYLIILDNFGTPIFYKDVPWSANDFKLQPNGLLTYFDVKNRCFYALDSMYRVVDTFRCGNEYAGVTDMHELRITNDGHAFLLAYDPQIVGMDTVVPGGHPQATVIGLIVQELDNNKDVIFEWKSWDHFKITETADWIDLTDSIIDYVHGNSIEIDSDSTLMISSRYFDEITRIDRRNGEIIWRFGGKMNQFEFVNDSIGFSMQHSIRLMPDSINISIFDNGNKHTPFPYSSALEYYIDENYMTATLVKRIRNNPDVFCSWMGHTQRLPDGRLVNGWGHVDRASLATEYVPGITEYKEDGSVAIEISFEETNYRAFKFNWDVEILSFDHDTLDFGVLIYIDSLTRTVSITNNYFEAFTITGMHCNSGAFRCLEVLPITMDPGEEIQVEVQFKPEKLVVYNDVLTFCWDIDSDTLRRRISGQLPVRASTNWVGINEGYNNNIRIYPNPVIDFLYINLQHTADYSTTVYDLTGRMLMKRSHDISDNIQLDFRNIPKGVYVIEIENSLNGKISVRKIVK